MSFYFQLINGLKKLIYLILSKNNNLLGDLANSLETRKEIYFPGIRLILLMILIMAICGNMTKKLSWSVLYYINPSDNKAFHGTPQKFQRKILFSKTKKMEIFILTPGLSQLKLIYQIKLKWLKSSMELQ